MARLRARVEAGFESLGRFLIRRRWAALAAVALVVAGLVSQLPGLRRDNSNEIYFRPNDPALVAYEAFREQFGRDEMIVIAVEPPEVFDRDFLATLREFHEALEAELPYLDEVTSLVNVRNTRGEDDTLIVEELLEDLPQTEAELAQLERRVMDSEYYRDLYITADGRYTAVLVETLAFSPAAEEADDLLAGFDEGTEPAAAPAERQRLTPEENAAVVAAVEAVVQRFESPDFRLYVAGTPVLVDYINRAIPQDVGTFMTLSFVAFAIFLALLFRRFTGVFVPIVLVLVAMAATLSLMAIFDAPFTTVTTVLPSFMIAVGIGSSVHLLAVFFRDFQGHGDRSRAIVYALGHSGLPIAMTALTTAAGLLSFATSGLVPVAHLGLFGGAGVLVILVFTLVLVPALLAVLPLRQHPRFGGMAHGAGMDRLLTGIARFATRHAWPVVIVSALVVGAAAYGLVWQRFSHNMVRWIPKSTEIRQDLDLVDARLRGSATMEVIVDTGRENGLYEPAVMNDLEALARRAETYRDPTGEPLVGKTVSVADVLKETHRALNENRQDHYAIPQDRELIAQELLLFENSGSDDLERLVDSQFSTARLTVKVLREDASTYTVFKNWMRDQAAEIFSDSAKIDITGIVALFTQTIHLAIVSMAESYLIAGGVITVLMVLLLGSLRFGLLSMIPNLAPIVVTLGAMGWLGIHLDMSNMLLGTVAIGLAVDDTIHFFHNFRRYFVQTGSAVEATRQTMLTTGRAILFTTLVLVTGFFLFAFASLVNLIHFGVLIGVTLIFALLADILLAPAMMELITRTAYGRRATHNWGAG